MLVYLRHTDEWAEVIASCSVMYLAKDSDGCMVFVFKDGTELIKQQSEGN